MASSGGSCVSKDIIKRKQMCLSRSGKLSMVGRRVCLKPQCKVEGGLPTNCALS